MSNFNKKLHEIILKIQVVKGRLLPFSVLDEQVNINFKFGQFHKVKTNLNKLIYRLAFLSGNDTDQIKIQCLLWKVQELLNAWKDQHGNFCPEIIPFGNSQHFYIDRRLCLQDGGGTHKTLAPSYPEDSWPWNAEDKFLHR